MGAYLQFGHDSWNLMEQDGLSRYTGIIISPVNDSPVTVRERLRRLKGKREGKEVILDPQLYNPASDKGELAAWSYFPSDFETAARDDVRWWRRVGGRVVREAESLGLDAVCAPAFVPKIFSDDYYRLMVEIADGVWAEARQKGLDTLLTLIIKLDDLSESGRPDAIASIISSSQCDRVYLFFYSDVPLREHYQDVGSIAAAIRLIRMLSAAMRVQVAFCAHDIVLWKYAGAQDAASGKFLNLRRFSFGRWSEDNSGGRNIPYWTDHSLLTLLREADVALLIRHALLDEAAISSNPFSIEIMRIVAGGTKEPWLGLSWRQYLYWFAEIEGRLRGASDSLKLLRSSDRDWGRVQKEKILFFDRFNDGTWVRAWMNACRESEG